MPVVDNPISEKSASTATDAVLVFLVAACLYVPFLSQQFDLNGIAEANALDTGVLFSANHMLYRPLGLLAVRFAQLLGLAVPSIRILQLFSAVGGAASIALAYVFFRGLDCSRFSSVAAALWLATTWAYWVFSTDAIYVPIAALFVAGASAAVLGQSRRWVVVAGALLGLAVATWEANVLLIPVVLVGVCLSGPRSRREMLERTGHFIWACLVPICVLYFVGAALSGIRTFRALMTWVTSHGNGIVLPMWGQFELSRVALTAKTAANSLVPFSSVTWQMAGVLVISTLLLSSVTMTERAFPRRTTVWLAGAYLAFVPFIIWWDPWEAKWFVVPNIFLGALFARLLHFVMRRRSAKGTIAAKAGITALIALSSVTNFRATVWGRRYAENPNLELSRCVASHLRADDVLLSTDWGWSGYLGYFFNRRELSVIDVSAAVGDPELASEALWQEIGQVQKSGGSAFVTDLASYPREYVEWLESQTHLRYEDLAMYQGGMAFECRGTRFRHIPAFQASNAGYGSSDRFKLSVSSNEVHVGEKYRLTISNVSRKSALVRYRLNEGPIAQFGVQLDADGSIEFDVGQTTEKGLYRFVGFHVTGDVGWISADASIRVR